MPRKPKGPKLPAGITDEFVNEVNSSSADDRKAMIIRIQTQLEDSKKFLKENSDLKDQRDALKLAEGPTRDAIKVLRNRTAYLIEQLKQQGAI
jgi:hypothetical protein